ncbi:hypothetical protein QKV95_gp083 [Poseidoniales virus YSH_150918]|uniref:Uncharacterized protein n=1 Tax=Poseidoniales virus YSH_150918 TaxID=3071324 RepID=A0A976YF53_9CAUD|nr:hypothetical protein QKV95_gp083 [Yangshan Harbor Poseidoniales virus]UVF62560.1 hypothetical protein [Poseidoniales virus YSH_150918]
MNLRNIDTKFKELLEREREREKAIAELVGIEMSFSEEFILKEAEKIYVEYVQNEIKKEIEKIMGVL